MAEIGVAGALRLFCSADQFGCRPQRPPPHQSALVSEPKAPKPTLSIEVATHERGRCEVSADAYGSASMARATLSRHSPTVGAGCLNWARPDLRGGRPERDVPTAIVGPCARSSRSWQCEVAYLLAFACGVVLCLLLYWRMPRADSLPNDVESLKKLLSAAHDRVQHLSALNRPGIPGGSIT